MKLAAYSQSPNRPLPNGQIVTGLFKATINDYPSSYPYHQLQRMLGLQVDLQS